ncbi:MAG: acyltransferase [Leptospirales bacterium]
MSRFSTDLLRVIAVTYVVLNHSTWNAFVEVGADRAHAGSWFFAVLNQLGKPSVLLFLFLSGFAFGVHPKWGRRVDHDRFAFSIGFYRNRALRILPPYILMSLIGFAILKIQSAVAVPSPAGAVHGSESPYYEIAGTFAVDFIVGLFDGRHMFHLYFVALLCYLYLLFPWIVGGFPRAAAPVEGGARGDALNARGGRLLRIALALFVALSPIVLVYLLVDPHNRYLQTQIPYIAEFAPRVQAWLSGEATSWLILLAYALPFFIAGVRVGQYTRLRREPVIAGSVPPTAGPPGAVDRLLSYAAARGLARRNLKRGALCIGAASAFALVFGDFLFHVFQTGQFPDFAGRIWRPVVVVYAGLAVAIMWAFTNQSNAGEGGPVLRKLARLSFLVYLTHPLLQFAFSGLPFAWRVPLILGLAWPLALALSALARKYRLAGFLLGEGDREFAAERAGTAVARSGELAPAR